MTPTNALPYFGGKAYNSPQGNGRWVASLLPVDKSVAYIEPYFGMGGVLLQRSRAKAEIANDIDRRLYTWWLVVRDRHSELCELLLYTPIARVTFEEALGKLTSESELDVAWAVTVILSLSVKPTLSSTPGHWVARGASHSTTPFDKVAARIETIAKRLRRVQLECCDAVSLMERRARHSNQVMYVDPPYYSTPESSAYSHSEVNVEALTVALQSQQGFVAVSGYGAEWDHLGWQKHSLSVQSQLALARGARDSNRTEHLWTNYEVAT